MCKATFAECEGFETYAHRFYIGDTPIPGRIYSCADTASESECCLRSPLPQYTGVGCYTILYIVRDCRELVEMCATCASIWRDLAAFRGEPNPIVDVGTYDEGPPIECGDCGREIESSYGAPSE